MAYHLDSSAKYLSRSPLWTGGDFTMALWIRRPTYSQRTAMIVQDIDGSNNPYASIQMPYDAGQVETVVWQNGTSNITERTTNASPYAGDTWFHACGIWTASGYTISSQRAVLNGDWAASDYRTGTYGLGTPDTFQIGDSSSGFNGYVIEVAFWNRALPQADVEGLAGYGGGSKFKPTAYPTSLAGYWPLRANANDSSGNGNNLTVNGSASLVTTYDSELTLVDGGSSESLVLTPRRQFFFNRRIIQH